MVVVAAAEGGIASTPSSVRALALTSASPWSRAAVAVAADSTADLCLTSSVSPSEPLPPNVLLSSSSPQKLSSKLKLLLKLLPRLGRSAR